MILLKYRVHFYERAAPFPTHLIVRAPSPEVAKLLVARRRRRIVEANPFNVSNMLPDAIDIDLPVWRIRVAVARVWLRTVATRLWNRAWVRRPNP